MSLGVQTRARAADITATAKIQIKSPRNGLVALTIRENSINFMEGRFFLGNDC